MPTDVVQVRQGRWSLRHAHREFHPANLFGGPWGRLTPADIVDGLDVEYDETNGQLSGIRRYPVLPATTRQLVARHGCQHPGVALDKLAYRYGDQNLAKGTLSDVVRVNQSLWEACQQDSRHWYRGQLARWQETIRRSSPGAVPFRCVTTGPLTLHLARASALENAGICLHPLYGFVYLPGSGLKGMARAYAETVWFPAQYAADEAGMPKDEVERGKAVDAWRTIEAVFGWAPNSDSKKPWKPDAIPPHAKHDREHCGQIVFHDAWPTAWPKLIVDILNNHHAGYYQGDDAPGDWENPVPVYFLAVERDTEFEFALARRRDDVPNSLLDQARQWLLGALCHLGAGAKTNAGYGSFKPVEGQRPALASPRHETFEATLELVTPAFLAGANQQAGDCDLRPATLRGLLRWWWRTLHAGFVDVPTLRAMEAAIWGDTEAGGPVRIEIERDSGSEPTRYNKRQIAFQHALPKPPNAKTTQGLWYHSYGMDDGPAGSGRQRCFVSAGAKWNVRLIACSARYASRHGGLAREIKPHSVLEQARAALWLLCRFGGVGAKSRKGFGSLADLPGFTLDECRGCADRLRTALGIANVFRQEWARSPALHHAVVPDGGVQPFLEIRLPIADPWIALDRIGAAAQAFAQQYKHNLSKNALGLPRKIRPLHSGQFLGKFRLSDQVKSTQRHATPLLYHLAKGEGQSLVLRVIAFPAAELPDLSTSRDFLREALTHLRDELVPSSRSARGPAAPRMPRPATVKPINAGQDNRLGTLHRQGDRWVARFEGDQRDAVIVNPAGLPGDLKEGSQAEFYIEAASKHQGIRARFKRIR